MSEHAKLIECLLTRPVQARGENRSSIPVCGSDRLLFQDPRKDWKLLIALRKSYRPLRAPPQAHAHQPPIKREAATQCSPIRWRSIQRRRRRAGPRPTSSSSASGSSRRSRRLTQWTIPDSDSSKLELPVLATPPSVRYSGYRSIIEPRLVVAPILRGCLERVLAVAPHAAEPLPEELRDMPPAANASWGRVWDDSVSLQESLFSPKGVRESPKYYPSHRSWSPTVPHEDRGRSGSSSSSPVLHDVSTQDETLPESVSERINESVFHPQTSPALECPADIADSDRPAGSDDPASQCQPDASKHYLKAEPGECSAPIIEVGPNEPLSCKPRGCSSSIIDVGPDWNPGDPPLLEPNGCSSPIIDVGTDWNQNDPLPSEPSGCSNRILDVGPEWTPDGPSHFVQSPSPSSVVSIWDDEGEPMDDAPPRNWRTPDEDCPTGDWTGPIREIEIGNCPQEPSDESKNEPTRICRDLWSLTGEGPSFNPKLAQKTFARSSSRRTSSTRPILPGGDSWDDTTSFLPSLSSTPIGPPQKPDGGEKSTRFPRTAPSPAHSHAEPEPSSEIWWLHDGTHARVSEPTPGGDPSGPECSFNAETNLLGSEEDLQDQADRSPEVVGAPRESADISSDLGIEPLPHRGPRPIPASSSEGIESEFNASIGQTTPDEGSAQPALTVQPSDLGEQAGDELRVGLERSPQGIPLRVRPLEPGTVVAPPKRPYRRISDITGIVFPTRATQRKIKSFTGRSAQLNSSLYLSSVMQYMSTEVLAGAARLSELRGRSFIKAQDIRSIFQWDKDLRQFTKDVVLPLKLA